MDLRDSAARRYIVAHIKSCGQPGRYRGHRLPGAIVCRSTLTNPTNGCVPYNLYGTGVNSAAAVRYVLGSGAKDFRSTTRDVQRLIGELRKDGAQALIMDLRANGGPDNRVTQCSPGNIVIAGVTYPIPASNVTAASLVPGAANRCDNIKNLDIIPEQDHQSATLTIDQTVAQVLSWWQARQPFAAPAKG